MTARDPESAGMAGAEVPAGQAGASGEITLDALREVFDEWWLWEGSGQCHAMRTGTFEAEGPRSLIRPYVAADTPQGLADQLSLQEWLRRMSAAELEAVWRDGLGAVAQ